MNEQERKAKLSEAQQDFEFHLDHAFSRFEDDPNFNEIGFLSYTHFDTDDQEKIVVSIKIVYQKLENQHLPQFEIVESKRMNMGVGHAETEKDQELWWFANEMAIRCLDEAREWTEEYNEE